MWYSPFWGAKLIKWRCCVTASLHYWTFEVGVVGTQSYGIIVDQQPLDNLGLFCPYQSSLMFFLSFLRPHLWIGILFRSNFMLITSIWLMAFVRQKARIGLFLPNVIDLLNVVKLNDLFLICIDVGIRLFICSCRRVHHLVEVSKHALDRVGVLIVKQRRRSP